MLKTSSATNAGAANLELKACHGFYATAEQFYTCCPSESPSPSPECLEQEQVKPSSYVNYTGRSSGMWGGLIFVVPTTATTRGGSSLSEHGRVLQLPGNQQF